MIPEAAVEAAVAAYLTEYNYNAEEVVKLVLEAAAPHMLAEAWDDGEEAGGLNHAAEECPGVEQISNPYRSAK